MTACMVPAFDARAHETGSLHVHAFGEIGARALDGELYIAVRPGVVLESDSFNLIIAPLLHFGLDDDNRPALRSEDLDSLGDYGRALYLLHARGRDGRWAVRAGALANESLGSGSVVGGWVASLDPDSARTAVRLDISGDAFSLEAIASGLFDLVLLAARLQVSPVVLAGGSGRAAGSWRIGVLGAVDPNAPVALSGELGGERKPEAVTEAVGYVALDMRLTLYRDHRVLIEPYTDVVFSVGGPRAGQGALHSGLLTQVETRAPWRFLLEAEVRRLDAGYLARPFDAFYSLERWGFPIGSSSTKVAADAIAAGWGGGLGLGLCREGRGRVGLDLEGRRHGPSSVAANAVFSELGQFSVTGLVAIRGLGWDGADPWWLALAEFRWHPATALYLALRGGRTFRIDLLEARYRPAWDVGFAFGATL